MQTSEQQLDRIFHALADRTRRQILMTVREQDATVNTIASQFRVSLPAISRHLKVLEQSGLISRHKDGQRRYCHAEPEIMKNAEAWLAWYQEFWNERLDGLAAFLEDQG